MIVETELYLAQSISGKLHDLGYECEIVSSASDALKQGEYNVVLLSPNLSGQSIYPIIEKYKKSIIILMISYISGETVTNPIKAGAKDYILKPFMIDELLRKVEHFMEFEQIKAQKEALSEYIELSLDGYSGKVDTSKPIFPLLIKTNNQKSADSYVFMLFRKLGASFDLISAPIKQDKLAKISKNRPLYFPNFHDLKKSEKIDAYEQLKDYKVVFTTLDEAEELPIKTIEVKSEGVVHENRELLPIDEYVKLILINYQDKYPDTELSKRLGVSRKSLWEKRRKFGIFKQK